MTSSTRCFNSLPQLIGINKPSKLSLYTDKYLLKKTIYNNNNYLNFLCWKSKCLYNMYLNEYSYENKIFSLDLNIKDDFIKIKHLSINNDYYDKTSYYNYDRYNNISMNRLTDEETLQIKKFVFNYIVAYANEKNINKIIIDIHRNLERYNCELKDEGFIPIYNKKCNSNTYWIYAEKIIYKK
jgi:hypothetical protein